MPKYYVDAGFQKVITADSPELAAIHAFQKLNKKTLNSITIVSETGFDTNNEDWFFNTIDILEKSGQLENYKSKDWLH
jgi:hypothetical protein